MDVSPAGIPSYFSSGGAANSFPVSGMDPRFSQVYQQVMQSQQGNGQARTTKNQGANGFTMDEMTSYLQNMVVGKNVVLTGFGESPNVVICDEVSYDGQDYILKTSQFEDPIKVEFVGYFGSRDQQQRLTNQYRDPALMNFQINQMAQMNQSLQSVGVNSDVSSTLAGANSLNTAQSPQIGSRYQSDRFSVTNLSTKKKSYESIGLNGDQLVLLKNGRTVSLRFVRMRYE